MEPENIEHYYELASCIVRAASSLITAYCFGRLVQPFLCAGAQRTGKNVSLLALRKRYAGRTGLAYFLVMEILYYIPVYFNNFTAYSLGVLAAFLVMSLSDRRNLNQKAFLSVTFFSLRWLSFAMENCIDKAIFYASSRLPLYPFSWKLRLGVFMISSVLYIMLSFIFLSIPVWLINRTYTHKTDLVTGREALMLSMPSLSGMLAYAVLKYYDTIYEREAGKSLFDLYGAYDALCFVYYGVSFVTILVVVILFQNLKERQAEEKQNALLAGQVKDMERHINEVEKLYQNIRSLKHDMGNHVMTIEGLYNKKEYEEARKYADQLREQLFHTDMEIKSGNPVTDVILTEKYKEAQEKGIDFTCEFHYPQGTKINAFDVSIILNNALANAIEAADACEAPFILISSRRKKNAFMIAVENNCKDKIVLDETSGLPITTKGDADGHGLGLKNIRRVAQKYYGEIDIVCQDGRFILNIMLMCV